MLSRSILGAAALITSALAQQNNNNQGADATQLLPNAIQSGSFFDGQDALGASDEQVESDISQNNFINFCAGKELTNGLQIVTGSCNGIPMGEIPAKNKMISTIILNPKNGDTINSGQDFQIVVQVNGLQAGAFTNAFATYYSAPQRLNGQGNVIGHTHVTVQDLGGSLNPQQPPDPTQFAFFKGINDAGNGQGQLAADVTGGLPPGNYRVCTLTSGSNHQPAIMPVAQRGSQDDCTKFTVVGNDNDVNNAANNGAGGIENAQEAQQAVDLGPGALVDGENANANATAGQDQANQNNQNNNQGNQGNQNQGNQNQGNQNQGNQNQGNQNQGNQNQGNQNQGNQNQGNQNQGNQNQGNQNQGNQNQGNQNQGNQNQGNQNQGNQNQGNQNQGNQNQGNQGNQNNQGNQVAQQRAQVEAERQRIAQEAAAQRAAADQANGNNRLARLARRNFIA